MIASGNMFENQRVIVTGGAGFIGSHLADELLRQGAFVKVLDNMQTSQPAVVQEHKKHKNYAFKKIDVFKEPSKLKTEFTETDFVFHLAANADIRGGITNTRVDLEQNIIATHNVLEAMRLNDVKKICFTSSGAVYGNTKVVPTPENVELVQTSLYGATKLAAESVIQAYSEYYGFSNWIYRFVSILGERYPHGVVIDFVHKLKKDSKHLEILGNGKQKKSFLHIEDCIKGVFLGIEKSKQKNNTFNLGNNYTMNVDQVADIVIEEMGLSNVSRSYTGGEVGWIGDQPLVLLSTEKIGKLGWKPRISIEDAIRTTTRYLLANM